MKHIIFVWIPIVLFALFLLVPLFVEFPVPFSGAIILVGASISGYTGFKSFGIYQSAKTLPTGQGVTQETKDKMKKILIALYVIILEALIIQYLRPLLELPLDDLFVMAAISSGVVLGGTQAMKSAEKTEGVKIE